MLRQVIALAAAAESYHHSHEAWNLCHVGDAIQWFEDDARAPIAAGRFESIADIPRSAQ